MPIRVVLLGDHPSDLLPQLSALPAANEFEVLGVHRDSKSAREALLSQAPDVALVAAMLADQSGFDFVANLAPSERPSSVVFVSAREEDAVRAFELQATDFVPAPVHVGRLEDAMARARNRALQLALLRTAEELQRLIGATAAARAAAPATMAGSSVSTSSIGSGFPLRDGDAWTIASGESNEAWRASSASYEPATVREQSARTLSALVGAGEHLQFGRTASPIPGWRQTSAVPVQLVGRTRGRAAGTGEGVLDLTQGSDAAKLGADGRPLRVLVREGRRTRFIPLTDVDWFEADGNYILVHAAEQRYRTRGTISAIESGLDPRQFVRIHRRMVVNMDRVREMSPLPGGDGLLVLGSGATLRLSRTYRSRVK